MNVSYSIFQNEIAPFLYLFNAHQQKLIECHWLMDKLSIQFITKNAFFKKWPLLELQLEQYFKGKIVQFSIDLDLTQYRPNSFTKKVGAVIAAIPYGSTMTYQNIAAELINPRAFQAVGQACKANPFPLIIPCHRVLAKNGLGGYSGKKHQSIQLEIKQKLLQFEQEMLKHN